MVKKPTDPEAFLYHIIESIEAIDRYIIDYDKGNLLRDEKTQDAVMRKIEIIGEAAKNLPLSFRKKYPQIPWNKATGMRDKLIHEYFGVDIHLVWQTITNDLPKLKSQIQSIIRQQKL